jgi:olfactory receptor
MLILKLDFCASNVIDHFSCDYSHFTVLIFRHMAVGEDWLLLCLCCSVVHIGISDSVLHSIITNHIENSICHLRKKAFSTCSSHLIVISISYGCCMFIYVKFSATERSSLTKRVAVLNTSVAPMLNSFIYNLRNQQLKQACKDLAHKVVFFRSKWKYGWHE